MDTQTLDQFRQGRAATGPGVDNGTKSATTVAPSPSKGESGVGSMVFWLVVVLMVIGGFGLLFFMMRGKFKSIEDDIDGLDAGESETDPLKRDIQTLSADMKALRGENAATLTSYAHVKEVYLVQGDAMEQDLRTLPSRVLKAHIQEADTEGSVDLAVLLRRVAESESYMISKEGDGLAFKPDREGDTSWVLNSDGLMRRSGEVASTLSFSDEWVRVCNGTNCSEAALKPVAVSDAEHDVPKKPSNTLELLNSIAVPVIKAAVTVKLPTCSFSDVPGSVDEGLEKDRRLQAFELKLYELVETKARAYGVDISNVCFLMDCPRDQIWRKSLLPSYKECRVKSADFDPGAFRRARDVVLPAFVDQGAHTFGCDGAEADDIAAGLARAAANNDAKDVVIITGDSDFAQLVHGPVRVHDVYGACLLTKQGLLDPKIALLRKILSGDKADNIPSIKARLGPKTAAALTDDPGALEALLQCPVVEAAYVRNRTLIDLSSSPAHVQDAVDAVVDVPRVAKEPAVNVA